MQSIPIYRYTMTHHMAGGDMVDHHTFDPTAPGDIMHHDAISGEPIGISSSASDIELAGYLYLPEPLIGEVYETQTGEMALEVRHGKDRACFWVRDVTKGGVGYAFRGLGARYRRVN